MTADQLGHAVRRAASDNLSNFELFWAIKRGSIVIVAHKPDCPNKRVLHMHFGASPYPRAGWWCVGCGMAQVQGHPPLTETDRATLAALAASADEAMKKGAG